MTSNEQMPGSYEKQIEIIRKGQQKVRMQKI